MKKICFSEARLLNKRYF